MGESYGGGDIARHGHAVVAVRNVGLSGLKLLVAAASASHSVRHGVAHNGQHGLRRL